jgi:hypothetical protein
MKLPPQRLGWAAAGVAGRIAAGLAAEGVAGVMERCMGWAAPGAVLVLGGGV